MLRPRITFHEDIGNHTISLYDPLWSGDELRSLNEAYDWDRTYHRGIFSFNWIFSVCLF
jgi:hypothetical protein